MIEPHEGAVELRNTFAFVHQWLSVKADVILTTSAGTQFTAQAGLTKRGSHTGEPVIRFFQGGIEFGRAYEPMVRLFMVNFLNFHERRFA